jgi:Domain of unknown function (DUF4926)
MMSIELYKEMALKRDMPERRLRAGDVGTVVEILPHPTGGPRGVMLEIFNAVGESIDVVTVPETDVQPLRADEILHVRSLSKAG